MVEQVSQVLKIVFARLRSNGSSTQSPKTFIIFVNFHVNLLTPSNMFPKAYPSSFIILLLHYIVSIYYLFVSPY